MKKWNRNDLVLLKKYESTSNFLSSLPEEIKSDFQVLAQKKLLYQAQLIILNKDVIGYVNNQPAGIYSFKEALKEEETYLKKGLIFMYRPLKEKEHLH